MTADASLLRFGIFTTQCDACADQLDGGEISLGEIRCQEHLGATCHGCLEVKPGNLIDQICGSCRALKQRMEQARCEHCGRFMAEGDYEVMPERRDPPYDSDGYVYHRGGCPK